MRHAGWQLAHHRDTTVMEHNYRIGSRMISLIINIIVAGVKPTLLGLQKDM